MNNHNVLIAGCGDVGCELARQLLAQQCFTVWGLRRTVARLPAGVHPIKGDLFRADALGQWPQTIDYLVYCAATDGRTEAQYRKAYVDGLQNVLHRLQHENYHPKRIIFTSSTSTFHQSQGEWVTEASPTEPTKYNGKIMLEAEALLDHAPFKTTTVRLGGIYGPGRYRLIERVRQGQGCPAEPKVFSNRIHIKDAAGIIAHLIHQDIDERPVDSLYLGVDGHPSTLHETLNWLALQLSKPLDNTHMQPPQRGNRRCSNRKIADTGYRYSYEDFKAGYLEIL